MALGTFDIPNTVVFAFVEGQFLILGEFKEYEMIDVRPCKLEAFLF